MIYWYSECESIENLVKEKGYEPALGVPVLSVKGAELLSSPAVRRAMQVKLPDILHSSIDDLWNYQYAEIVKFLERCHISKEEDWLQAFDHNLSQVVFDKEDNIRALVLCTSDTEGIVVHLLLGATKASEYIMCALQGFLNAAMGKLTGDAQIIMVAAQQMVPVLLRRMLSKKYEVETLGQVHFLDAGDDIGSELSTALQEAEEDSAIHRNIRWKLPWAMAAQRL